MKKNATRAAAGLLAFALAWHAETAEEKAPAAREAIANPALAAVVATERSFVKLCAEKGVRDSFLAFFAEDAIQFSPAPVSAREALQKRPAPPTPLPTLLHWEPVTGDISAAGDLAYLTGPWIFTDRKNEKPPLHGTFFSVWRRQPDGTFRVALDMGTQNPAPPPRQGERPFVAVAKAAPNKATQPEPAREEALLQTDRNYLAAAQSQGLLEATLAVLDGNARLHRDGALPIVGQEAIRAHLAARPLALRGEVYKSGIARSGDLGYTYGRYEKYEPKRNSPAAAVGTIETIETIQKGYYTRVWRRDAKGAFRLVADIENAEPPK